jgi:starch-binding outer membrane protein, SusD/RagB family
MKNNKKITTIALVVLLAAGLYSVTGCNKQLTTKVYSQLTPQNFYQSDADAFAALVTIYVPFTSYWGNVDPGNGTWYAGLYNADIKTYLSKSLIGTDEIYNVGTDVNTSNLFNFSWGPSTWTLSSGNEANYGKITYVAKATQVINDISNSSNISAASKNLYVAEAKVLRAWLMFVLYDFYGPVNVKTDPATLADTSETARPTATAYVAQMVKDITEALPSLPAKYNGDANNWGRMSQGAANMILLKIYMRTKQWALAQAQATTLMNMGYSLMTGPNGYLNIFTQSANKEVIYAVPSNAASPNFWAQEVFPQDFQSAPDAYVPIGNRAVGWLTQYMPWAYYGLYDPADIRRNTTILDHYTNNSNVVKNKSNGMPGAIPLKYTSFPQGNIPGQGVDVVVFRYAEVLLSLAEAINEQSGPSAAAYQAVNAVRERAGLGDWSGLTQAQLRDSLLNERGRELYAEGVRRQDLIRNGTYISSAIARGKNAQAYDTLFPIPYSVIVAGRGIIAQNPGY